MGQTADELKADLYSGDALRVAAGIANLRERMRTGQEIELPPFGVEILNAFGEDVPERTQLDFITLVERYHSFSPKKPEAEKIAALVGLVLRFAQRQIAFEVALRLKISPDPAAAATRAISEIVGQGLSSPRALTGAKLLVSRLLDGTNDVRHATLEGLRGWPKEPPAQEVIAYVTPQLETAEAEALGSGNNS